MGKGKKILLVDDEEVVVEVGQKLLEALGYDVAIDRDARRALEVFEADPREFDLIITDYAMPHINGMDFAGKILQIRPGMPIILCTGFSEQVTTQNAAKLGVELLMKPYGLSQLAELINKVLGDRPAPQLSMASC